MPDARVSILIEAQDRANGVLDKLNRNLTTLGANKGGGFGAASAGAKELGGSVDMASLAVGKLVPMIAAAGVGSMFLGALKGAVAFNMQLETLTLTYETLLGSASKAQQRIEELKQFAAVTPFRFEEVLEADRLLQTFGVRSKEILTLVGDAAAGTGQKFSEVAFWIGRAYSAIQAGQPFGEAAMRLQEMGILTATGRLEIEKLTGANASAEDVQARLNKELEKYGGLMEKQSQTAAGQWATLQDEFSMLTADLVSGFMPVMTLTIGLLTDLVGVAGDVSDAIGIVSDKLGDIPGLDKAEDVFGFFGDVLDKIPDEAKAAGAAFGAMATPMGWVTLAGVGLVKVADKITGSVDEAGNALENTALSADTFRTSFSAAQLAVAGIGERVSGELAHIGSMPPMDAVFANHGNIDLFIAQILGGKRTTEEWMQIIEDTINAPTMAELTKRAEISQAKYSVALLESKAATKGLTAADQKWLDWLKAVKIPTLEAEGHVFDALKDKQLDAAKRNQMRAAANKKEALSLRNDLIPALRSAGGEVTALAALSPTTLEIGFTPDPLVVPFPEDPTEQVHIGMEAGFGKNKTPNEIIISGIYDPTEKVKVGMIENGFPEGKTPNQIIAEGKYDPTEKVKVGMVDRGFDAMMGPNAIIASGKYDPTEQVKVGMHDKGFDLGETPNAIIASGKYDPTEQIKVGMVDRGFDLLLTPNAIIASGKYDPTEKVKVGMQDKGYPVGLTPNAIIASGKYDPTEMVKVGMRDKGFPEGLTPNQIIASGKYDPTEQVKVGMHDKGFPEGLTPNAIIASGKYDPTEKVKVGMQDKGFPEGLSPNAIIVSGKYDPSERVKVGMVEAGFPNGTPNEIIARGDYDPTELVKVGMTTTTAGNVWKIVQDYMNAHPVTAAVIYPRPDQRGVEPGAADTGGMGFTLNVYFEGPTLATEAEMQRAARLLVPPLRRELDRLYI